MTEMRLKKLLTASQLEHLEEHIPYELLMLRFTLAKLKTEKHPLAWNAMLESFAVHARNLYWFLINKRNHQEDHIASQFTDSYTVPNTSEMTGPFQRLNQQVMHLGKQRKRADADKFQTHQADSVAGWIESAVPRFREALAPEVKQRFKLDAVPPQGSARLDELVAVIPQQTSSSFPHFWFTKIG
jgi:hypothetical protein